MKRMFYKHLLKKEKCKRKIFKTAGKYQINRFCAGQEENMKMLCFS
jgi:hypothetical protein